MLISASLAAAFSFAAISAGNVVHAGSTSAKIMVSARVLAVTNLKILHQAREIIITDEDIRKGYRYGKRLVHPSQE